MHDDRDRQILELNDQLARASRVYGERIEELEAENQLAWATLASIGGAVLTTDARTVVRYLNPAAEQLTGWTVDRAAGRGLAEVVRLVETSSGAVAGMDLAACLEGRELSLEEGCALERRDGRRFTVCGTVSPIRGGGEVLGLVVALEDTSDRQRASRELTRAASHDALTGLLNREAFDPHLEQALAASGSDGDSCVLCYMDLDQFRVINDTCGHAAGDQLLQWIASLIRERVRDSDVLARLAGDEFALLLPHCPMTAAERIADDLHRALKNFRFIWQDKSFAVDMSLGLVPASTAFDELSDWLGAADHACSLAKEKGPGRTQVYQHDAAEIRRHQGEMNWVVKIREALDEDRFELYWQRIQKVSRPDERRLFYEVLLRLPDGGEIHTPGEFLVAAERFKLMPAIDRWVVSRTLETLSSQTPADLETLECCSVNLSGASIGDDTLLGYVEREFDRTGFPAGKICFEITETAAVKNLERAARMIERLRARGCRWALDDFGSGMSSYRYLRELPVHYIKIDGDITSGLGKSLLSRAMVQSIHQIGHVMDVETIAEAVDGEAMLRELAAIGVDYAQGFGIERPRPMTLAGAGVERRFEVRAGA